MKRFFLSVLIAATILPAWASAEDSRPADPAKPAAAASGAKKTTAKKPAAKSQTSAKKPDGKPGEQKCDPNAPGGFTAADGSATCAPPPAGSAQDPKVNTLEDIYAAPDEDVARATGNDRAPDETGANEPPR